MSGLADFAAGALIGVGNLSAKEILLESENQKAQALERLRGQLSMDEAEFSQGRADTRQARVDRLATERTERSDRRADARLGHQIATSDRRQARADAQANQRLEISEAGATGRARLQADARDTREIVQTDEGSFLADKHGNLTPLIFDDETSREIRDRETADLAESGAHLSMVEKAANAEVGKRRANIVSAPGARSGSGLSAYTKEYNTARVLASSYPEIFPTEMEAMQFQKQLGSKDRQSALLDLTKMIKDGPRGMTMSSQEVAAEANRLYDELFGREPAGPARQDPGAAPGAAPTQKMGELSSEDLEQWSSMMSDLREKMQATP